MSEARFPTLEEMAEGLNRRFLAYREGAPLPRHLVFQTPAGGWVVWNNYYETWDAVCFTHAEAIEFISQWYSEETKW